jgi:hypothetical protein
VAKLNLKKIRAKAEEIKAREKARKQGGGNKDSAFINKLPAGTVEIRLMPPWSSDGDLAKEIWTHFGLPPGGTTVVDIEQSHPKRNLTNPINTVLEDFQGDLDVTRLWAKATPKVNVYFPESDINEDSDLDPSVLGKVKIFSPSVGCYNQIVKIISNPRVGDITDAYDGYTLTIEKTTGAKWQDTRYNVQLCPGAHPIVEDEDELEAILEKTWDLDKMFPAPDDSKIAEVEAVAKALRKHLEKQLRGSGGMTSSRSNPRTRKPREEAEEEVDEVEEEEEQPKPRKKAKKKKAKKKARKKKVVEEDDDDYSGDPPFSQGEEEEDSPPKKARSSKKKAKKKSSRANTKPDCYADPDVFKIDDDQYNICDSCIWEIPCQREQQKAGVYVYEGD